ncbi:MAG: hypothetical protein ACR2NX_12725 [Chthoniobacterales bacterium]
MIDHFDIRNSAFGIPPVPPFNDSDWFRTAMREAQNPKQGRLTCRVWEDKDDEVRWQWREATWTTNGSPKGEHNQAHQYPSPQRGNANFAWVQHFIHHLAPLFLWNDRMPQGSLKRGDRQRAARAQAITSAAVGDAVA